MIRAIECIERCRRRAQPSVVRGSVGAAVRAVLHTALLGGVLTAAALSVASPPSDPLPAPEYSFDAASPAVAVGTVGAADVLEIGIARPRPVFERDALELSSSLDDIDALSGANAAVPRDEILALLFSVDRATVGTAAPDPGLVAHGRPFNAQDQSSRRHGAGDQFIAADSFTKEGVALPGTEDPLANNILARNNFDEGGTDFVAYPATHAGSWLDETSVEDRVDAMATLPRRESDGRVDRLYFSLAAGSPTLIILAGGAEPSGADVFLSRRPPSGPCCRRDGVCEVVTGPECLITGGTWLGPEATCDSCSTENGACCLPTVCVELPAFLCALTDGRFFAGRGCGDIDCETVLSGACCLRNGRCVGDVTDERCAQEGGVFFEDRACDGIDCEPRRGACCTPFGCVEVVEKMCVSFGGVFYADRRCDEIECAARPRGACCRPNGKCVEEVTAEQCAIVEGNFFENATCDEAGCDRRGRPGRTEAGAAPAGGSGGVRGPRAADGRTWAIPDECEPLGICCLPGGGCAVTGPLPCDASGGVWLGAGVACGRCGVRAPCCLPGGVCELRNPAACAAGRGRWLGPESTCEDCRPPRPIHHVSRYARHVDFGLVADDDIDGMVVFDENDNGRFDGDDRVLFSLAPGSPSLLTIDGASDEGAAADVFVARPGRPLAVFAPARLLGLGAAGDNIDALDAVVETAGLGRAAVHGIRACRVR